MSFRRVVVTGVGGVTPLGATADETWDALLRGKSGISHLEGPLAEANAIKIAAQVQDFDPEKYLTSREVRRMDRFSQFALASSEEAIKDAGLDNIDNSVKENISVVWASGTGGIGTVEVALNNLYHDPDYGKKNHKHRFSPFYIPRFISDIAAGLISMRYGFRGGDCAIVAACASSGYAISSAMNLICLGRSDIVVTGGSEAALSHSCLGGFAALGALSERNDSPETASRPFDKDRDGFVIGEGAGTLVLEEYEHAKRRNAKIYAELLGYGTSGDSYHLTAPDPDGLGVCLAMKRAMAHAKVTPESVSYINTHATSTVLGDVAEVDAIRKVFGSHSKNLLINATKSMSGHLLGAASAIEALFTIKVLGTGRIPPTINHFELDPLLDPTLNYCFNPPASAPVQVAMSNSFGFGGHNVSLVFGRCVD